MQAGSGLLKLHYIEVSLLFMYYIKGWSLTIFCTIHSVKGKAYKEQVFKFFNLQGTSTQVLKIKEQNWKKVLKILLFLTFSTIFGKF